MRTKLRANVRPRAESRMREIRTYGLTRGRALRDIRGVPLYSAELSAEQFLRQGDSSEMFYRPVRVDFGAQEQDF